MPTRCGRPAFALFLAAVFSFAILAAHSARSEGGEPRYFAIVNARIVPVSGPLIEGGTVVVAKGLIQSVGSTASIPPEAWVIDGKGLTVYPGLIDTGTSLALAAPKDGAEHDSTFSTGPQDRPVTTPWKVAADLLDPGDKRIAAWRDAGFTTTLTAPSGGIFPGQGSIIDLEGDRPGDMVVRSTAALPISLQPIPGWFQFPDSLMGSIAYVRQVFDDSRWYAQSEPVYQANPRKFERPAYDRTERVIARVLADRELILLSANNSVQLRRGLRLTEEWKIPVALFGAQQGYEVASEIAAQKIPVIVNLNWPQPPKDPDPEAEQTLRQLRFRARAPSTPAAFAKAGVLFAFSSGGLDGPKDIFKSVKKAMDAGLAPDAALRAFTLDAAQILGVADRVGSIEPGKIANLVVTDGDIFSEKTKVKDVFVDGRWFEIREDAPPANPGDQGSGKKPAAFEGVGR